MSSKIKVLVAVLPPALEEINISRASERKRVSKIKKKKNQFCQGENEEISGDKE